jgi:hypothetical protein
MHPSGRAGFQQLHMIKLAIGSGSFPADKETGNNRDGFPD